MYKITETFFKIYLFVFHIRQKLKTGLKDMWVVSSYRLNNDNIYLIALMY